MGAYPVLTSTLRICHLARAWWGSLHACAACWLDNKVVINGSALGQRRATRMQSTFATSPRAAEAASISHAVAIDAEVNIMKALVSTLFVACALAAPVAAFAQTAEAPVTRAQVLADLVRVEHAGYRPTATDINYPDDIQHAEAIVAQEEAQQAAPGNNAVGGVAMTGSTDSGAPVVTSAGGRSIYAGH
ncbi:DUF4148 domain-containing protein [Paraburkholderia sp.]|uniref:DUF4148 domain-containing protein n=1 Tax=Paraburkholderia sp. TaxID=1926495 RepID=UPI002D7F14B3|nr:DUF4148 domain-containing protein [Paraburkholderia sp.]